MASYDSAVNELEGKLRWEREEMSQLTDKERRARTSLENAVTDAERGWGGDIEKAVRVQESCETKIKGYEQKLDYERRGTQPNESNIKTYESELRWLREEIAIQVANERNYRTSLERKVSELRKSWGGDIENAISAQRRCETNIKSLEDRLETARREASQKQKAA